MTPDGHVTAIHTAPEAGDPMQPQETVTAVAGKGLKGDRYFNQAGSWSGDKGRDLPPEDRAITLFESEILEIVERDENITLSPEDHRRNITTTGIAADHLVDHQFTLGNAVCEGVAICEPCAYLESLTQDGVLNALIHRGGLNARIIETGDITINDPITIH